MTTPEDRAPLEAADVLERFSRRLGGDVIRYLPSVAAPSLVSLAIVTIFTRVFDPAEFGRYSVAFVSCSMLIALAGGWLSQSIIRYLPRYRADNDVPRFKSMASALLLATLIVIAVAFALAYPLVARRLGPFRDFYWPGAVMVVAGVGFQTLRSLFQANLQSNAYARAEVISSLGRIAFALAFVFLVSRDAVGLIVGPALSFTLAFLVMILWHHLIGAVRAHPGAFRLSLAPQFLRFGFPVIGFTIGVKVLEMSDRYIIEYLRGSAEVGVYSANYGIAAMGIWIVATPVLLAAHPLIFNAWESGGRERIQDLVSLFSRYYLLVSIPLFAFVVVFSGDVAAFLLGEEFRVGESIVPVVFGGLLLWNLGFYGHKAIKLLEKTSLMFALVCVCAAVNIGLNFALVPQYGYMGAAVATLIGAALYPVMVFFTTRRYLAWIVPWGSIARIAVAATVAAAVAAVVASFAGNVAPVVRLLAGFFVGAPVYALMLIVIREVRSDERSAVAKLMRGTRP